MEGVIATTEHTAFAEVVTWRASRPGTIRVLLFSGKTR